MADEQAPLPAAPADRFNFADHLLRANAHRADRIAYVDDRSTLTFGALDDDVRRVAGALRAEGFRREERVVVLMHDETRWPVAFLGSAYAGLVPVALNPLLTETDLAYTIGHARAQAVFVSAALVPALRSALARGDHEVRRVVVAGACALESNEVAFDSFAAHEPADAPASTHADDMAFWLYSSGSTGRPKAAVHTHASPYWTAELYGKAILGLRKDDVCLSAAKLFFAYGLGNALTFPLSVGATTILCGERPTPDAVFARWRGAREGLRPTVFFGAPTGYAAILAHPDLPEKSEVALRLASSAGEALPAELGVRFEKRFGAPVVDGIGSTEMLHVFLSNRPDRVRYGTTGWPVPGYTVEVRNDDGSIAPDGTPADLWVRGPSSALMYWRDRARSRDVFHGGWTRCGDKYVRNDDGSFTYAGRSDDMLKVSGQYVSPFEVEAALAEHPAVLEAALVGVIDASGLTRSKAFVVLRDGASATEAELQAFVKTRLAPHKYPRAIAFVADLPKTATGKIQRFKLRERE